MKLLLQADDGTTQEYALEVLPEDTDIVLLRSNILTKQIGRKAIVLPARVKGVEIIRQ